MQDLIPIRMMPVAGSPVNTVNARELHGYLGVGRDFANWIKARIKKYGFVEGVDFITVSRSPVLASGNRGASTEYHLTLDMGKELAMVENNDQGRKARLYFIEMEKRARGMASSGDRILDMIEAIKASHLAQIELERRQDVMERRMAAVEADMNGNDDFVTMVGYMKLNGMTVDNYSAAKLGRSMTAYCAQNNYQTRKVNNQVWGEVNAYPKNALSEFFAKKAN